MFSPSSFLHSNHLSLHEFVAQPKQRALHDMIFSNKGGLAYLRYGFAVKTEGKSSSKRWAKGISKYGG